MNTLWHRDVIMFFLSRRKCVYLSHRTWMNYEKHQFQQRWAQSLLQQLLGYPHFLGGTQILWYQQQNSLDYTCMVLPLKYKEVRESVTSRHLLGNKSPNHHTLHFAAEHTPVWAIVSEPREMLLWDLELKINLHVFSNNQLVFLYIRYSNGGEICIICTIAWIFFMCTEAKRVVLKSFYQEAMQL